MTQHGKVHQKGTFALADLLENVRKNPRFEETGAITLFIGVARGTNQKGEKVEKLRLEAYEEKANETLENICEELEKKPGITDVQIHHLIGEFNVGEELVYVSVAGSHRTEIFPILREAVEKYKHEAAVFKKERVVDAEGKTTEAWVSEQQHDSQS